jgi:hypothetical protein
VSRPLLPDCCDMAVAGIATPIASNNPRLFWAASKPWRHQCPTKHFTFFIDNTIVEVVVVSFAQSSKSSPASHTHLSRRRNCCLIAEVVVVVVAVAVISAVDCCGNSIFFTPASNLSNPSSIHFLQMHPDERPLHRKEHTTLFGDGSGKTIDIDLDR